jgi:hypothetical protein
MHAEEDARRCVLGVSDLAGIHSLYGGMPDEVSDLLISPAQGSAEAGSALRRIAPAAITSWTTFDTDADGAEEVLIWRTDREGYGALIVHHFAARALPARSTGPLLGATLPGAGVDCAVAPSGERIFANVLADGRLQLAAFDSLGLLDPRGPIPDLVFRSGAEDLDGDGILDDPRDAAELALRPRQRVADLDGDGHHERIHCPLPVVEPQQD